MPQATASSDDGEEAESPPWESLPTMQHPRHRFGLCTLGNKAFVIGGARGAKWEQPVRTVDIFDFHTRTWEAGPEMSRKRYGCCACACRGLIYALGGNHAGGTVEAYDPLHPDQGWRPVAPMAFPRRHFHAVVLGGQIFALFGMTGSGTFFSSAERYDPDKG